MDTLIFIASQSGILQDSERDKGSKDERVVESRPGERNKGEQPSEIESRCTAERVDAQKKIEYKKEIW